METQCLVKGHDKVWFIFSEEYTMVTVHFFDQPSRGFPKEPARELWKQLRKRGYRIIK